MDMTGGIGPQRWTRRSTLIAVSALGLVAAPAAAAFGPPCGGAGLAVVTLLPGIAGLVGLLVGGRMLEMASGTALAAWVVTIIVAEGRWATAPPMSADLALGSAAVASAGLLMLALVNRFPAAQPRSVYRRGGWIAIALVLAAVLYVIAGVLALSMTFSDCFSLGSGGF